MFKSLRAARAARNARRHYESVRIEIMMRENQRRLDEIEAERNAPCKWCAGKELSERARARA